MKEHLSATVFIEDLVTLVKEFMSKRKKNV